MRRPSPLVGAGCAVALAISSSGLVGATRQEAKQPIALDATGGFSVVGERILPNGAALATFRAGEVTVSVIGQPGSFASAEWQAASEATEGRLVASLATSRPKTAAMRLPTATPGAR